MQYIKNLAGIDAIALGSDFDGFGEPCELSGAEKMQQLTAEMERQGFSSAEIDKVFSLNALRVFRSVLS
jgi:membrane dipeptidase